MSIFDHHQRLMAFQACKTLSHAHSQYRTALCMCAVLCGCVYVLLEHEKINVSVFRRMHKNKHELNEVGLLFLSLTVKNLTNRKFHATDGALRK